MNNAHAIEKKASAAKEVVHRVVFGTPLAEMRRQFNKATKKDVKRVPFVGLVFACLGLLLLGIAVAHAGYSVHLEPNNPGWYSLVWAYGAAAFVLAGIIFHKIPTSSTSALLLLCTIVVGFLAVPFTAGMLVDINAVTIIIAVPFAVLFGILLNQYARRFILHNEGYRV